MKRWLLRVSVVLCALAVLAVGGWWAWREFWSADQFGKAVAEGDFSRAERLKAWGADTGPWREEDSGWQLIFAIEHGMDEDAMRLLVLGAQTEEAHGVYPQSLFYSPLQDGLTPLHIATRRANPTLVRALLDAGADVNAKDNGGNTPIDVAKRKHLHELVAILRGGAGP